MTQIFAAVYFSPPTWLVYVFGEDLWIAQLEYHLWLSVYILQPITMQMGIELEFDFSTRRTVELCLKLGLKCDL